MLNMLLCQYCVIVSGEVSYGTPLKNIKENTAGATHLLYIKGFSSKWIQTATVWIEILFWRHKSSVRFCDILHTMLLIHMTSSTHVLNLHSDQASPSPPVGRMRSISETLPLHYGREDLVQNNAQRTQSRGLICMLPLCWWALCSMLMHVCVCWAKLFCVKFSPGSKGNTSGWLSPSPFTHQPVYWPSGLDGSHWAKAARCNLVFYNPESCW